jgi:uncharacterized secreted protein with C-terminal beta-propeller domain
MSHVDRVARLPQRQTKLQAIERLEQRCFMDVGFADGLWSISGDTNPAQRADEIVIDRDPTDPSVLRAIVNGTIVDGRREVDVRAISISAGAGADIVRIDESLGDILISASISGGTGADQLRGGSGDDFLAGGRGGDTLVGGDGDDRLQGEAGRDRLEGGAGRDMLRGGRRDDTLWGDAGDDQMRGGPGRDRMHGGGSNDTLLGGQDNDTLTGRGDDPTTRGNPPRTGAATVGASDDPDAALDEAEDNDLLDGGAGDNVLVDGDGSDTLQNGRAPESLQPFASCDDLARELQARAQDRVNYYKGWFPLRGEGDVVFFNQDDIATTGLREMAADLGSPSTDGPPGFSNTNTQETGVDEADIVKTDGSYLYLLRGGELIVIDAWPGDEARVVSRTAVEGNGLGLYVAGNRAMIFSGVYTDKLVDETSGVLDIFESSGAFRAYALKVTLLDLSNRQAPTVLQESYVEGGYVDSREVNGQVYLVVSSPVYTPTPWQLYTERGVYVESAEHFEQRVAAATAESMLPQFVTREATADGWVVQTGSVLGDCGDVYRAGDDPWWSVTSVLSFDLAGAEAGPTDTASVFGSVGVVYASTENLYLVRQAWHPGGSVAAIHKFDLGDGVDLTASGEVPGWVLNQFALDEEGPYLRIATSDSNWNGREQGVYVLTQEGDDLNVIGSVEQIAPGESLVAARFFGDRAYLVTFEQIDPLFTLDMSDPTDPHVVGELEVPGFSSYLHPVDRDHLLAIGREGSALQVSLYDVSDLAHPTQLDRYHIEPGNDAGAWGWNWSDALWDHHAFSYFPEYQTMAIPVDGSWYSQEDSDGDGDIDLYQYEHESDLWVFHVDTETGIDLVGQVNDDATIERSLRIGDLLYSIGSERVKIQSIAAPDDTLATVEVAPAPADDGEDSGNGDEVTIIGRTVQPAGDSAAELTRLENCDALTQELIDRALQNGDRWPIVWGGFLNSWRLTAATEDALFTGVPSHSDTNTQEAGVDEADLVETDGQFLYVLRNGELVVVDAVPAESAAVIGRLAIEGYNAQLYVSGDRAFVLSTVYRAGTQLPAIDGFDSSWGNSSASVKVTVIDLSDRANPTVVEESYLDGYLNTSRLVGDRLILVVNNYPNLPAPWSLSTERGYFTETDEHFETRARQQTLESILPGFETHVRTSDGETVQSGSLLTDCTELYKGADYYSLTSVLAFDATGATAGPADSASLFGQVDTVYVSAGNLYAVRNTYDNDASASRIHKFSLAGDVRLKATGAVPGTVAGRFSLDEAGGYLRVATTDGRWTGDHWHRDNAVYVLTQTGESLDIAGSVTGIAHDETITAARFFDDYGFLVTAEWTDPLFTLDLTDPTNPRVVGELEVPGFSSYLHPVDATHLLAIGREGSAVHVSLYDVSDFANPVQVDRYLIDRASTGGWQWSEALWDPHAFAYFAETRTLAIPIEGWGTVSVDIDGDGATDWLTHGFQSELFVFHVDTTGGFDLRGRVESDSRIQRSLRIGDNLYAVARDQVLVQPLAAPANTIIALSLTSPAPEADEAGE